ncbi:hypothetical protein Tsubulata_028318 [Turnera subulata]|uniref:Small ribosomal subunit protein uS5c n=1 Tax=Turnera subulata TaxID=218843 RepID=A0A9Q0FP35_9ROSI|nr:hypothetical protein Tsubulata_028318 [Turnera subulata]
MATLSSLYSPAFSLPLSKPPSTKFSSSSSTFLFSLTPKSPLLSLSSHPIKPTTTTALKAQSGSGGDFDSPPERDPVPEPTRVYYPLDDYDEVVTVPKDFITGFEESEEQTAMAYEERYGPAYSGETYFGNDVLVMDPPDDGRRGWALLKRERVKIKDDLEETVVETRMVSKVTKGGRSMSYRIVMVVGNRQGLVGVGVGNARDVPTAIDKACVDARRHLISVPITKHLTIPHRAEGKFGGAKVMLRPASPGFGLHAGSLVRNVLELAGFRNGAGKQLGSRNLLNNCRATIVALEQMRSYQQVAEDRGIPIEELWK